jgi:UDP-N-acetylmuramyl pentapeptide phosphotransferase/UDP-N-acetylglucosamine-1-phosphate transferase
MSPSDPWLHFLVFAAALGASFALTGAVTRYLRQRAIFDLPNERSSHAVPTPRGGGWGVVLTVMPGWALIGRFTDSADRMAVMLCGLALLAAISWTDDRRTLSPLPRLAAQVLAVAAGLGVLDPGLLVFQGWLPWMLDRLAAGVCWLWFINLFNFMDGIDGLAGSETAAVAGGAGLALSLAGLPFPALILQSLVVAGAGLGFLAWNWHPARVFLGDVGSIPLGYALGWLLLGLAGTGLWPAALLLPLYFLVDATVTLLRRLLRGERIWQAHREHFYQRAVQAGRSHAQVSRAVIVANLGLLLLAAAAPWLGWPVLPLGALTVLALLGFWRYGPGQR